MTINNFQRIGSAYNAGVGLLFEEKVREFFLKKGIVLKHGFAVPIGVADRKKLHKFDLGSDNPRILVECNILGPKGEYAKRQDDRLERSNVLFPHRSGGISQNSIWS